MTATSSEVVVTVRIPLVDSRRQRFPCPHGWVKQSTRTIYSAAPWTVLLERCSRMCGAFRYTPL